MYAFAYMIFTKCEDMANQRLTLHSDLAIGINN